MMKNYTKAKISTAVLREVEISAKRKGSVTALLWRDLWNAWGGLVPREVEDSLKFCWNNHVLIICTLFAIWTMQVLFLRNPTRLQFGVSTCITLLTFLRFGGKKLIAGIFPKIWVRERTTIWLFAPKVFLCHQVKAVLISQLHFTPIVFIYCQLVLVISKFVRILNTQTTKFSIKVSSHIFILLEDFSRWLAFSSWNHFLNQKNNPNLIFIVKSS